MIFLLLFVGLAAVSARSAEKPPLANAAVAGRSFVDGSQIVSRFTTELYAHQSSLKIVKGIGYAAYQCNDTSVEENVTGQKARLVIFNILNPTATARWVDISGPGDSSNGIVITGNTVINPMLHVVNSDTLRIFFVSRQAGDTGPTVRAFYKDYTFSSGELSDLHQVRCMIGKPGGKTVDLSQSNVQSHLDHLFGAGVGAEFSRGISLSCDMMKFDGYLYSTVQIKNSSGGKTLLMTNVLMRSADDGATWELLGAPDPRQLPGETPDDVKILAEPAMTHDRKNIYLHLRSNVLKNGYMLSKASKTNLYAFDMPVTKWTYGIGRPAICDFGKPIGIVAMFTAQSVSMGGTTVTRNKCDVVMIDPTYTTYTLAFTIVDYDAVNTPFICEYNDEMYVTYSTGRRRLTPRFGTSEIVFTKLRREFFVDTK